MGRLVRVDVGVLDDDLAGTPGRVGSRRQQGANERRPVEEEVEIAAALDARLPHAGGKPDRRGEIGRDRARRAAQRPREVEGRGRGEIAEGHARRPLEHDSIELGGQALPSRGAQRLRERLTNFFEHRARASIGGRPILIEGLESAGEPSASGRPLHCRAGDSLRRVRRLHARLRPALLALRGSARRPASRRELGRGFHRPARHDGGDRPRKDRRVRAGEPPRRRRDLRRAPRGRGARPASGSS